MKISFYILFLFLTNILLAKNTKAFTTVDLYSINIPIKNQFNKKGKQQLKTPNLYVYEDNGLFGYIDKNGKIAIPAKYAHANKFSICGLAKVIEPNKKFGYINLKGEYVLKPKYILASNFIDNKAFIHQDGVFKIINIQGLIIHSLPKNIIDINLSKKEIHKGYIVKTTTGKNGLIDNNGQLLIDTLYNQLININDSLFLDQHFHSYDSTTYKILNIASPLINYLYIEHYENWETGEIEFIVRNKNTLKTEALTPKILNKKIIPFYKSDYDSIIQYIDRTTEDIILETKSKRQRKFKKHRFKHARYYKKRSINNEKSGLFKSKNEFTYIPSKETSKIKTIHRVVFPIQELYLAKSTWTNPLDEFISTFENSHFKPVFNTIDSGFSYSFQLPEIYGDIKVKARIKLEIIQNNSDTTTVVSKPYKTKIPSYFLLNLDPWVIKSFIDN